MDPKNRDFLNHLETYLAKRDGVDKLLKISRYTTKIIIASSLLPESSGSLTHRLKSFESSVGLSRKAFRLGKFVQDINALRASSPSSPPDSSRLDLLLLPVIAYGGEGLYYFVEQFIWLAKSGLIDARHAKWLQKISAWAELVGYVGSVSLKVRDLRKIEGEIEMSREVGDEEKMKKLKEKKTLKVLSVLQDVADGLMTIADLRDGKGVLSAPSVISSAGLFSAVISTHKNWVSC
ncbi:peroxisomal membrane protein 11A [Raphanus sativus]|uniref:Peroxisomal membrane protein 11A n=1 Tax=Raphanus sativus TaxID=3726 RepID=A0A6J0PAD1_RAPSA|nr:peroxisomal membrane protein 11A [Raphanus sativus]